MSNGGSVLNSAESTSEKNFLDSVYEFIENEKQSLAGPQNGADEQRYFIYSVAFDKVIEHTIAYKKVLAVIKREYDSLIRAIKKKHYEARMSQGRLKARLSEPASIMYCHRRSAQLRERIEIIQRDTSELQTQLTRRRNSEFGKRSAQEQYIPACQDVWPFFHIPGLTFKEMMSQYALSEHLERLEQKRADLLSRKKSQLRANLDSQTSIQTWRDELLRENVKLGLRNTQLRFINDSLRSWEKSGGERQLVDILPVILQQTSELKGQDSRTECIMSTPCEETSIESWLLEEFTDLLKCDSEDDSAAITPQEAIQKFRAMASKGGVSPLLLFLQASMASVHAGTWLPSKELSVEVVKCALQHNRLELVTHWITQKKLSYSEELGDVIWAYQRGGQRAADTCLTLAQLVYGACGARRKVVACLCRRDMTHTALELIRRDGAFTIDDCLYVLKSGPSAALIQGLTTECRGRPPVLSLGLVTLDLLATDGEGLAFQLLESIHGSSPGALEGAILADTGCTPEGWGEIAERCGIQDRSQLAQEILTVLTSQHGTVLLSPGDDGAELMEHVFM